ncbi:MAG: hypothetical protein KA100_06530 [Rickettsiales bacterium]|nr:hypothetical protein [Rickettsiales bacterium]
MFFSLIILSGIVTFFILSASTKNKFDANPQTTNGINHNYFTSTHKGTTHVFIAVDRDDDDVRFIIRTEKWYDVFFKFLKLTKEFQSGDSRFDKELFLLSDQNKVNAIIK